MNPTDRLNQALTGRYRIERELGEGGMATVYLADDLRHGRKVALKVLKPELAAVVGAERFLAEIRTTAGLQHPHILPLFDSGEASGFLYYVMPFVEEETLRDRLDRERHLPVEDAVRIASAVAHALQAAHDAGVVHRDVKPANVLLSRGEPLVADFGIALAVGAAGGHRLTETGLSVGTPFYMSPEQATGDQHVGPATDQYALACVLYEMLTGDPPYVGSTAQAVLGKIIQGAPPPIRDARPSVPPHVEGAVLRALERLPADRFTSAKDFAAALADPSFRHGEPTAAAGDHPQRAWTPLTTVFAGLAAVSVGIAAWALLGPEPPTPIVRYEMAFPEGSEITGVEDRQRLAVTRDGRRLIYVGSSDDGTSTQLWIRERDRLDPVPIPGTEGARNPSLSPDESEVAYAIPVGDELQLRAIPLDGGPSRLLSDSLVDNGGVAWADDGWVYHDARLEGDGLARVSRDGGDPEPVTMPGPGELWHSGPVALPGGRGVLFYAAGVDSIGVVDTRTGEHRLLDHGWGVAYSPSGHLLWVTSEGTMMAAPFDLDLLEIVGRRVPVIEGLSFGVFGGWSVAVSDEGTLMYMPGVARGRRDPLVWLEPGGAVTPFDDTWVHLFADVELSPDGSRVAVAMLESEEGRSDIWVRPMDGGPPVRMTFDGFNVAPEWTPDGRRLLFGTRTDQAWDLMLKDVAASGPGRRILEGFARWFDLSEDGTWIVYGGDAAEHHAQRVDGELRAVGDPIELDFGPEATLQSGGRLTEPRLSPDGRWLAYTTGVAGRPIVEVRPFPRTSEGRWTIAVGAFRPRWSPDGRSLYFKWPARSGLYGVDVSEGPTFAHGAPERISPLPLTFGATWSFDVAADGRFLLPDTRAVGERDLVVVQGFFTELRARVGG